MRIFSKQAEWKEEDNGAVGSYDKIPARKDIPPQNRRPLVHGESAGVGVSPLSPRSGETLVSQIQKSKRLIPTRKRASSLIIREKHENNFSAADLELLHTRTTRRLSVMSSSCSIFVPHAFGKFYMRRPHPRLLSQAAADGRLRLHRDVPLRVSAPTLWATSTPGSISRWPRSWRSQGRRSSCSRDLDSPVMLGDVRRSNVYHVQGIRRPPVYDASGRGPRPRPGRSDALPLLRRRRDLRPWRIATDLAGPRPGPCRRHPDRAPGMLLHGDRNRRSRRSPTRSHRRSPTPVPSWSPRSSRCSTYLKTTGINPKGYAEARKAQCKVRIGCPGEAVEKVGGAFAPRRCVAILRVVMYGILGFAVQAGGGSCSSPGGFWLRQRNCLDAKKLPPASIAGPKRGD